MHRLIYIAACILVLSGCNHPENKGRFAMYIALGVPTYDKPFTDKDMHNAELEAEPFISEEDIVSYDLSSHFVELTDAAYERVSVEGTGRTFVVCVGDERIYWGTIWSGILSVSRDCIILDKMGGIRRGDHAHNTVSIELGYPSREYYSGKNDPRSDGRIIRSLERAGKLKNKQAVYDGLIHLSADSAVSLTALV